MRAKMTEKKKIQMIQLLYSNVYPYKQCDIAKKLDVYQSTISHWKKCEIVEIYLALMSFEAHQPGGLSKDELKAKYDITDDQLQRVLADAKKWFQNFEEEMKEG